MSPLVADVASLRQQGRGFLLCKRSAVSRQLSAKTLKAESGKSLQVSDTSRTSRKQVTDKFATCSTFRDFLRLALDLPETCPES